MTRDKIDALADWSSLPRVMYVTSARCIDGVVYEASMASVPMAIAPEVAYVSLAAIPGLADVLDGKAVILPRDPSAEQVDGLASRIRGAGFSGDSYLLARVCFDFACRASPYWKEPEA